MKKIKLYFGVLALMFLFTGCYRYILGTYVHQPKDGEPGSYSKTFDCSWEKGYTLTKDILKEMGVYIFFESEKERMMSTMYYNSVYRQSIDTTEVGIFFKDLGNNQTQVRVACGNYGLAEFASQQVFERLDKKLNPEKVEKTPKVEEQPLPVVPANQTTADNFGSNQTVSEEK